MNSRPEEMADLVRKAQQGDQSALASLYRQFSRSAFGNALRWSGDWDLAEELCSVVWLRVLLKLSTLRNPACFSAWFGSIMRRTFFNMMRKRHEPTLDLKDLVDLSGLGEDALSFLLRNECRERVRLGLSRSKPIDKDVLLLFYLHGMSLVEMSEVLHVPLGTVKRRLHVARKRIRRDLEAA